MDLPASFLVDIAANRDDDTPRLIYADWLDDHSDADQARFIRAQCRLAGLEPWEAEAFDLAADADDLLARHAKKWRGLLGGIAQRIEFRRGFPDRITLAGAQFAERAARATVAAPTLSACRITNASAAWEEILASPALEHFTALDLGGQRLNQDQLRALLQSPRLANLRELRLVKSSLRDIANDLATAPHITRLERLHLEECGLRDAGLQALLAGTVCRNLKVLHLVNNNLTAIGLAALAGWEKASQLVEVRLEDWGDADLAQAFAQGDWQSLQRLTLHLSRRGHDDTGLTSEGLSALATCPSLRALRSLHLLTTTRRSLGPLIGSPHLAGLRALGLAGEGKPRGLAALTRSPMTPGLQALVLDYDPIEDLHDTLLNPRTAGLTVLEVRGGIDSRRCLAETVAEATHLTNLRRFVTLNTSLDRTVRALADAAHLTNLLELEIQWLAPEITHAAELAENPHLNRLRRLHLSGFPPLPKKTVLALQKRFGKDVVTIA